MKRSRIAFAFASALDFCDGYIARNFNQKSRLGSLIDPIADKSLMVCVALSMGYSGLIHWPVAAVIVGKDILMGLGFFAIAWKHGYHSTVLLNFLIVEPSEMMEMVKSLEVKPSLLGKVGMILEVDE